MVTLLSVPVPVIGAWGAGQARYDEGEGHGGTDPPPEHGGTDTWRPRRETHSDTHTGGQHQGRLGKNVLWTASIKPRLLFSRAGYAS